MGLCGGGNGNNYSTTTTEPWDVQQDYLRDMFKSGWYGMTGYDTSGNQVGSNSKFVDMFKGDKAEGKLDYVGDKYGMWRDFDELRGSNQGLGGAGSGNYLETTAAPTIAGFTPAELAAQNIIKGRLKGQTSVDGYNTGYDNLLPTATTALQNVVSGANKINPASFSAANVSAPSSISERNIYAPSGYSTPTIENTNLDYRFWNPLGSMAGGNENNDYLENMIDYTRENLWSDYNNYAVPGLDTTAEDAGRYGTNTWSQLRSDLYDKTSENARKVETTLRGEAYNQDMNRALQAMNLGGTLAESQAGISANKALNQAQMELQNQSQRYGTQADINKLVGELGLEANKAQAANELQRNIQNAMLTQQEREGNAGFQQQANVQNVANILAGAPIAPEVSRADYQDVADLAAVGESQGQKQQDIIDAFVKRFETNQLEPYQRYALMSNLLSGDIGGVTTSRAPATSSGGCV